MDIVGQLKWHLGKRLNELKAEIAILYSRVVNLDYQVKDLTKELEQAQKHASLTNNILEQFLYHDHDKNRYCTQEHKVQERLEEIKGLHKELWPEHDEGMKFLTDYFLRVTDF